jgi:hypothetical protein
MNSRINLDKNYIFNEKENRFIIDYSSFDSDL